MPPPAVRRSSVPLKKRAALSHRPSPFVRDVALSVRAPRWLPAAAAAEPPEQPGKQRRPPPQCRPGKSSSPAAAAEPEEQRTEPEQRGQVPCQAERRNGSSGP